MAFATLSRAASFGWITISYATAGAVAFAVAARFGSRLPPWQVVALGDGVATVVVFAFSFFLDNSSVYDPYWSVAPMAIAPALLSTGAAPGASAVRGVAVVTLVLLWGIRLTYNWARGWQGLGHEDWRYAEYRRLGRAYWIVSLFGFHLMPTFWVYLGCLSLLPVFLRASPLSPLDAVALLVTGGAIAVEATADRQLRAFRLANRSPGRILDTGLWALCRHPNYLGELSFWWGLYLFALAAEPAKWWMAVGPMCITLLFVFVSVPLLDRRSVARRAGYAATMDQIPALFPRLFGRRS